MRQIPKAKTKDEVNFLFEQLETIDDDNIKGKNIIYSILILLLELFYRLLLLFINTYSTLLLA